MNEGQLIRHYINHNIELVERSGVSRIVDNVNTFEVINHSFDIYFDQLVQIVSVWREAEAYYQSIGMKYRDLYQIEEKEYTRIFDHFTTDKFHLFETDIHSRRVVWSDQCCISFIQFLIRSDVIHCFVQFRSSDVVVKQFADLYEIIKLICNLQYRTKINKAELHVRIGSMHIIEHN